MYSFFCAVSEWLLLAALLLRVALQEFGTSLICCCLHGGLVARLWARVCSRFLPVKRSFSSPRSTSARSCEHWWKMLVLCSFKNGPDQLCMKSVFRQLMLWRGAASIKLTWLLVFCLFWFQNISLRTKIAGWLTLTHLQEYGWMCVVLSTYIKEMKMEVTVYHLLLWVFVKGKMFVTSLSSCTEVHLLKSYILFWTIKSFCMIMLC